MALLTRLAPANSTYEGCLLIKEFDEVAPYLLGDLDGRFFLVTDEFFYADEESLGFFSFCIPP